MRGNEEKTDGEAELRGHCEGRGGGGGWGWEGKQRQEVSADERTLTEWQNEGSAEVG